MRIHKYTCPQGDGEPFVLAPLGDIQYTGRAESVAGEHLSRHIRRTVELGASYIGLGDYIDFMSPSNRSRLRSAELYDNAQDVIEDKAKALVKGVVGEYLEPTQGRWLGLVSGHHYTDLPDGDNTDALLAREYLRCPYTESLLCVRLTFTAPGERSGKVDIWAHHGNGSHKSTIRKLTEQAQNWPCDIFLMGHTTTRQAKPIPRLEFIERGDKVELRDKETWLVNTGGWSRAYQDREKADYVEKAMLPPVCLGAPLITIVPQWTNRRRFVPAIRVEV